MSDEEKKQDEEEEEEEDEEGLSDEERKKRRLRRLLKKLEKKYEKGRKVDAGFEGAYASKSWEGIVRHNFRYAPEEKDRAPEITPTAVSGDNWKEPQRWYPRISQSIENPVKNEESSASDKVFRFMEDLSEAVRQEVWNIFYEQSRLEELTEDELARIETDARLDLSKSVDDVIAKETQQPDAQPEHIPHDPSFSRTIFDTEPTDDDILHSETLRKLGHRRAVLGDSLEEEPDV